MRHEILTNGSVVWVNGGPHGACLARFGPKGIDVHSEDTVSCLLCTHGETTIEHWQMFVRAVKKFHGIDVPAKYTPRWLTHEKG